MPRLQFLHRLIRLSLVTGMVGFAISSPSFAESPQATPNATEKVDVPAPEVSATATATDKKTPENGPLLPPRPFQSEASFEMYNFLMGEILMRDGKAKQAVQHYVLAASRSSNSELIKRAAQSALQVNDPSLSKGILDRWTTLETDSLEVREYRILLNARQGNYEQALKDMVWVRDQIEKKEGHGFEFLVSLLALEVNAEHTLELFKRYASTIDGAPKSWLAVANFALSADRYEDVLKASDNIYANGDALQKEQAIRLKSKAYIGLKQLDQAATTLKPVAEATKDQQIRFEYARLLLVLDRSDEALPIFSEVYKAAPDNAEVLYTLGLLHLEKKQYKDAEELMKKLQDNPLRRSEASYFLGQIYEDQKRNDEALKAYEDALNGQFSKETIGRKATLLKREKGFSVAQAWLKDLTANASTAEDKVPALMALGQLLHDDNQYQAAVDTYSEAEKAGAKKSEVLYARSLSYEKMGSLEQAEKDLRSLISDNPKDADAMNALGYMLTVNTTRYQEAGELIDKALELSANNPAIMDSKGWIAYKLGDLATAETWLRKAFQAMEDPEIASHLIEVLSKNGKDVEAKQILKDMMVKHPNDKLLDDVQKRLSLLGI
ncbi:tetratricopeptide repeat protein [Thiolinea disciformis]|uniref:tetratricopeptide repeat protein n=1 Tax=Thiolinea disciformis TaxID=125614 RepID=UPI00037FA712|nr:tetratricopeptide repeat protein [Thiolinea disciformis]